MPIIKVARDSYWTKMAIGFCGLIIIINNYWQRNDQQPTVVDQD